MAESLDVCNSTDLPELEIISLLEEQLPVYRLRADTIFGYDHEDWLHTPLVAPDAALELTAEQIEETLKYFLLCADRVGQMTRTYNDIDAVTRLLEEKERDLELAARIGQSLLKKNKTLSEKNELLEEQVEHIREEVSQLRHDLSMKDELLQFYTSAAEESEGESPTSTAVRPSDPNVSVPNYFPLDSLQKKLKDLEAENLSLRSEASHLETETISYEEKEQQLVNDCVKELRDANLQMSSLAEELARKTEDASRQQEEITHLLSQIVDLQKKAKSFAVENEELTQHLGAAKDAQRQLTAELRELEDKYAECMEMLHEAQEELKNLRNKTLPHSTPRRFHSLGLFPMDSLAAEIEGTMRKELQMDDPEVEEQKLHPKRVFQTVKNLNLMRQQRSSLAPSPLNIPGSNQTSCFTSGRSSRVGTPRSNSIYGSETGSGIFLDNRASSILETPDKETEDSNRRPPGTPGTPGSRDLEAALRRLSLRRDNYLSERRFFEEERERKLAYLAKEEERGGGSDEGGPGTPTESLLSLCTHPSFGSVWSGYSYTSRSYLPEKLQIVKPLEGDCLSPNHNSQNPPQNQNENHQNPQKNQIQSSQNSLLDENQTVQNPQQNQNRSFPNSQQNCHQIGQSCNESFQNNSQSQSPALHNHQQNENQICQNPKHSQIFKNLSESVQTPQKSTRLLVLSSSATPHPKLRAPLAFVTGLLELLDQQAGSATLHAWQQLAQPHLGGLLDQRPGVVTKGFRTLEHEQEQDESWQMDQPEEDEVSLDTITGLPGVMRTSSPSSSPSASHYKNNDGSDISQSEALCGARGGVKGAIRGKDGHVSNTPHSSSPSSPTPHLPSSEMNGQLDFKEFQVLQAGAVDSMPVNFPGKCMSHSTSTYTFTTCRILHPSDQLASMTSSPVMASCQISDGIGTNTPTGSPIPFSSPATPSYTPCCTPRRLSLSRAESFTNLRDSTKTTSTSLGLVRLLLERGISASVYDPHSWDRGADRASGMSTPVGAGQTQGSVEGCEGMEGRSAGMRADALHLLLLPSTPPNSPTPRLRSKSASCPARSPAFQFSPSHDDPPYYDTFLASKPARTILREVLGESERERAGQADNESQTEVLNLRLVDKLKRFQTVTPLGASGSSGGALLGPFGPPGLGNSALGGGLPVLNAGLRRNRSYPAMVGASMAMKDPGGPPSTEILIPHTMPAPHMPHTLYTQEMGKLHTTHGLNSLDMHIPQTLDQQDVVIPRTVQHRQTNQNEALHHLTNNDQHNLSKQSSYSVDETGILTHMSTHKHP